jgi:Fe2+ transport system protein FeoA
VEIVEVTVVHAAPVADPVHVEEVTATDFKQTDPRT